MVVIVSGWIFAGRLMDILGAISVLGVVVAHEFKCWNTVQLAEGC